MGKTIDIVAEYEAGNEILVQNQDNYAPISPKDKKQTNTVNYTSFVSNETRKKEDKKKAPVFVKKIKGQDKAMAGELITYEVVEYQGEPTNKDKKKVKWMLWVNGEKIRLFDTKEREDSPYDILGRKEKKNSLYLYAKRSADKLEIKFSKWLDGEKVAIESYMHDVNGAGEDTVETTVTAPPEIRNAYWCNARGEKIREAGYKQKVFISIESLGLQGKNIDLEVFDDDSYWQEDSLKWDDNKAGINAREVVKEFPIKKKSEYKKQQDDEAFYSDELELYFRIKPGEPVENLKEDYGRYLILTPEEKVVRAYFAEKKEREVTEGNPVKEEKDEAPKPVQYTVVKNDYLAKIAKQHGVTVEEIKTANNLKGDTIQLGQVLTVPGVKPKAEATEKKNSKTLTWYEEVPGTTLGSDIELVVETLNLPGKEVTVKLYEKEPLLVEKDKELPVLKGDREVTGLTGKIDEETGKVVFDISFKRKDEKQHKEWIDKLNPPPAPMPDTYHDKKTDTSIHIPSEEAPPDPTRHTPVMEDPEPKKDHIWLQVACTGDEKDHKEAFLKKEGEYFIFDGEKTHLYEIHIDQYKYKKIKTPKENIKEYAYRVYYKKQLLKEYKMKSNEYNLLSFPETGPSWGRYGSRDKGGDNWINENTAAAFLGFLYTLPYIDYKGTLYYNDISANDKRNIGHKTHKSGHDIDIRYPGADNSPGQKLWTISEDIYGSEKKFIEILEKILKVAEDWGFTKNYAYKNNIKHTKGTATDVHQDHFHIGLNR